MCRDKDPCLYKFNRAKEKQVYKIESRPGIVGRGVRFPVLLEDGQVTQREHKNTQIRPNLNAAGHQDQRWTNNA